MSSTEAWSLLKKRTQQDSIFAKLNAMHIAIHTKFSHNTLTIDTLSELKNLLACIYEGGQAPTQEEWSIVLMLNAFEGSYYNSLHGHLITQFQYVKTAPSQKEVYNTIAFAGYEHKQKTNEQAHVAKFQKDPVSKNISRCTNLKCGWPKGHETKDCWFKVGISAHKAPEWWKEKQARRMSKIEKSAKANIAEEAKGSAETANISVELDTPLNGHFQDGYKSYPQVKTVQSPPSNGQETGMNTL